MEFALRAIDKYYEEIDRNKDIIRPVYCYDDIEKNRKNGFMNAMLTLEEGAVVHNDLRILRDFYRLGVRMITLTWNYENGIAFPNFTPGKDEDRGDMLRHINETDGLTPFGREYVKECNRLGIIVDVSHLGDKGFWDVIALSTKPIVASHSNARSVCGVARNMSDEMILALHNHIRDLGCIDNIGLGSDFDGISTRKEMEECSKMYLLCDALEKEGYTEEEIEKICYRNVLRVYEAVLK